MKISKRQLKKIIKEEKKKILNENRVGAPSPMKSRAHPSFVRALKGSNIREANQDGTIGPDEDEERELFLADIEIEIDDMIELIKRESYNIGGPYRGPGIKAEALRLIADKIHRVR